MEIIQYIKKIKKIIDKQIETDNYEQALVSAKILSDIYYDYNQIYSDSALEQALLKIKMKVLTEESYLTDKKCVFFYDGFGLDLRGWAASYVRALTNLGYYVLYGCPKAAKGRIPHIISELDNSNSKIIYFNNSLGKIDKAKKIDSIFKSYKPSAAFFYTTPSDVSAAIAFSNNNSTTRFQVDLTDHAFWIGLNAFDYTIECRKMGASLALYERGINERQILKLDCAPYIILDKLEEPYPFDIYNCKYVFTGGALYKTLGDKDLLYYKTISYILDNFRDVKFLYAGNGDDSEIQKLIKKYPERVFYINERADFFEIIKNSLLYINSYPMFGGLMMRYAALACKVPITLKHDHDADGILIDQENLGIEFENYQDYLKEIYKLLSDEKYREQQENRVQNAVISEKAFAENIDLMIKEQKTKYSFDKIEKVDTSRFREEYKNRYNHLKLYETIAKKENISMLKYFPKEFIYVLYLKIKEKVFR